MPRILDVVMHLSVEEMVEEFKQATDPMAKAVWRILLLKWGKCDADEIGRFMGLSAYQIRRIVHRYNAEGPAALKDKRLLRRQVRDYP